MSNTAEAALWILIGTLISTIGAFITARISGTSEKPSEALANIIKELRVENAVLKKINIELEERYKHHQQILREVMDERDAYITAYERTRRLARRWAPRDVIVPEVELPGTTPQDIKPNEDQ